MYARGIGSPLQYNQTYYKAINSPNPKRRYVGGLFAKPMLFIKNGLEIKCMKKPL